MLHDGNDVSGFSGVKVGPGQVSCACRASACLLEEALRRAAVLQALWEEGPGLVARWLLYQGLCRAQGEGVQGSGEGVELEDGVPGPGGFPPLFIRC